MKEAAIEAQENAVSDDDLIYYLTVGDVQNVAREEYGISLDYWDIRQLKNEVGDYIDWYQALVFAIQKVKPDLQ